MCQDLGHPSSCWACTACWCPNRCFQINLLHKISSISLFSSVLCLCYLILAKIFPEEITPLLPAVSGEKIAEDQTCYFLQLLLKYMVIQVRRMMFETVPIWRMCLWWKIKPVLHLCGAGFALPCFRLENHPRGVSLCWFWWAEVCHIVVIRINGCYPNLQNNCSVCSWLLLENWCGVKIQFVLFGHIPRWKGV